MDSVASDEHRSTAAARSSVRSIGTAFGAAIAGVVANVAGLGDATEPGAVGHAVTRGLYVLLHTLRARVIDDVPLCPRDAGQTGPDFVARRIGAAFAVEISRKVGWIVDAEALCWIVDAEAL
jgi:hypothetical protein